MEEKEKEKKSNLLLDIFFTLLLGITNVLEFLYKLFHRKTN